MRRALLAALAAAVTVAPAWAQEARPQAAGKGPKIVVEPPSFDFGAALQNKVLEKELLIRNAGTEDLVIENVATTCGCTVAELDTKTIKPGAQTPLRVKLETRTNQGKIVKNVIVRSNDPTTPSLQIKLEADVKPETSAPAAKK